MLKRKLFRAWLLRGPLGTAKYIANYPRTVVRDHFIVRRRNAVQAKFDRQFNVDTSGVISLAALDIDAPNWIHGEAYGPTSPTTFEAIMDDLAIDVSDFTFVDFGSGKGAVLLYALAYPFKEIIGVEFSLYLHRCADSNIARHPLTKRRAIRSIHCDATQFEVPRGPLFMFLNKPFSGVIMDAVLRNIRSSLHKSPRVIYVCTIRIEDDLSSLSSGDFLSRIKAGVTQEGLKYSIYVSSVVAG